MYHSFILWFLVRTLRPLLIVESGVYKGQTSWLLHQASLSWGATLLRIDPRDPLKEGTWMPSVRARQARVAAGLDLLGGNFTDFACVDFERRLQEMSISPERVLLVMDDHQDQSTTLLPVEHVQVIPQLVL